MKRVHILLEVDDQTRTGVCANCGPVKLRKKTRPQGRSQWRCREAGRKWDGGKRRSFSYRQYKKDYCEVPGCTTTIIDTCQLDIHHVDGNPNNNKPENLRTICACCHRLVTYAGLSVW